MTIYLSTARTLFMYVNIIFFTIYIWYCGYCKVFYESKLMTKEIVVNGFMKRLKG